MGRSNKKEKQLKKREPKKKISLFLGHPAKGTPDITPTLVRGTDLLDSEYPPREFLVEGFLQEKSLSMFVGPRGVGKTLFLLELTNSISSGEDFLEMKVVKPVRVLYIDGEMQIQEMQDRWNQITPNDECNNVDFLCSENVVDVLGRYLNFNTPSDQDALWGLLLEMYSRGEDYDVIIIDNLSSLTVGKEENSNSDQDSILDFARKLRHAGYAVILAHHTGKNDEQRGASRREDFLDLSVKLERVKPKENDTTTRIRMNIVKSRNKLKIPQKTLCYFGRNRNGRLTLNKEATEEKFPKRMEILQFISDTRPKEQKEIALHFKFSKQAAFKFVQQLRSDGFITGSLGITQKGTDALIDFTKKTTNSRRENGKPTGS